MNINRVMLACFFVSACASTNAKFDLSKLSDLQTGKTTYSEVIAKFGTPDFDHVKLTGERTILYNYGESNPSTSLTKKMMAEFTEQADPKQASEEMKFNENGILTKLETLQPTKLN